MPEASLSVEQEIRLLDFPGSVLGLLMLSDHYFHLIEFVVVVVAAVVPLVVPCVVVLLLF